MSVLARMQSFVSKLFSKVLLAKTNKPGWDVWRCAKKFRKNHVWRLTWCGRHWSLMTKLVGENIFLVLFTFHFKTVNPLRLECKSQQCHGSPGISLGFVNYCSESREIWIDFQTRKLIYFLISHWCRRRIALHNEDYTLTGIQPAKSTRLD